MVKYILFLALIMGACAYLFIPQVPAQVDTWFHNTTGAARSAIPSLGSSSTPPPIDNKFVGNTGVHKCIDARGNETYSNQDCPGGQSAEDVKLSQTNVANLNGGYHLPGAGAKPAPAAGSSSSSGSSEVPKSNALSSLHQKFGPAP